MPVKKLAIDPSAAPRVTDAGVAPGMWRRRFKAMLDGVAVVVTSPCALSCWVETWLSPHAEAFFVFWTNVFAILPGHPGVFLRRAFYRLTLEHCAGKFIVGFGALFAHRASRIEEGAYIGAYAIVGSAHLGRGCLIGSRASLLSGPAPHQPDGRGGWTASDPAQWRRIEIGRNAWIGEAAVVMADVGVGSLVAAGSVVSTPVPPGVVVGGNPARFVRRLSGESNGSRDADATGGGK
jgi:acetyltransferase-like isoleucine patch superfamily enzyme